MARVSGTGWEQVDQDAEPEQAREQPDLDQHRLAGEDSPFWLPTMLAIVGAAFAVAASSSWPSPDSFWRAISRTDAPEQSMVDQRAGEEPMRSTPSDIEQPIAPPDTPVAAREQERPAEASPHPAEKAAASSEQTASDNVSCLPAVNITFARGSARPIVAETEKSADALVQWMTRHEHAVLSVEGHADSTGTEQRNVLLSFSRAKAVISWLAGSGVPEGRMVARAAGASEAKGSPKDTPANRRALLRVEGVETCREIGNTMERQ